MPISWRPLVLYLPSSTCGQRFWSSCPRVIEIKQKALTGIVSNLYATTCRAGQATTFLYRDKRQRVDTSLTCTGQHLEILRYLCNHFPVFMFLTNSKRDKQILYTVGYMMGIQKICNFLFIMKNCFFIDNCTQNQLILQT